MGLRNMSSASNPQSDADQLEAAADQAIAACGGDAHEAVSEDFGLSSMMHFRMFRMFKGGDLQEEKLSLTVKDYTDKSATLTAAAREFVAIVRKIWKELNFRNLDPE